MSRADFESKNTPPQDVFYDEFISSQCYITAIQIRGRRLEYATHACRLYNEKWKGWQSAEKHYKDKAVNVVPREKIKHPESSSEFVHDLPKYGIKWNGLNTPLLVPMGDGYWTPWHIADTLIRATYKGGIE
jgi:hypothetical protein